MRAVLFDFYGTLAHARSWGPSYEDVLAGYGYTLADDVRVSWVSDAFDGQELAEHSVSRAHYIAWEKSRLADMCRACGVGDDDVDRLVDDLWTAGKQWELAAYPETAGVVAELRDRGIAVGVCSNWDWDLDRALAAAGLDGLFDAEITSAQAGARKPHPRIYRVALAALGDPAPGEVLFVGDSWAADVEGPRAVGLGAVHVHRPDDRRVPPPLVDGVARVADLEGVLSLL